MNQYKNQKVSDKHIIYAEYLQREETRYHHGYDEEMLQYKLWGICKA